MFDDNNEQWPPRRQKQNGALAAFMPGRVKNTFLRAAANALGIPLADEQPKSAFEGLQQMYKQPMIDESPWEANAFAPHQMPPLEQRQVPHGTWNLKRESRSPRVLYDSAMNRTTELGDADPWGYYDAETEQYIGDMTQKRSNPRYEFLSPEQADEKQRAWEKKNERWLKNWNALHGLPDELKEDELGRGQLNSYGLTGDIRQKREDEVIGQAAELAYKQPDSALGGIMHEFGKRVFKKENQLSKDLLEQGQTGYLFLKKRMELEERPLDFYRRSKKIRNIMEDEGLSLADAIEKGKREAVQAYMQEVFKSQKDNFGYKYMYDTLDEGAVKDFYGVTRDLFVDVPTRRRAKERREKYFEE